jgi:hypothetical protein
MENWTGTDDPIADVFWRLPLSAQAMPFWNCTFSLLAWVGVVCARRAEPLQCLPILVLFLFFPVIYYVTHNAPRYRHPMEPAMALLAVYAIACPMKVWREKRERQKVSVVSVEMAS